MWTSLAESAWLTRPWPCSTRSRPSPRSLADLVAATGLPRPTAHRLALALEHHQVLDPRRRRPIRHRRTGRCAGRRATTPCARRARGRRARAAGRHRRQRPGVPPRRATSGCASRPRSPPPGLRDTVPVGSLLTLRRRLGRPGPGRVAARRRARRPAAAAPRSPLPTWPACAAAAGRTASASASRAWPPSACRSRTPEGAVIAAVSISGPLERLARPDGRPAAHPADGRGRSSPAS